MDARQARCSWEGFFEYESNVKINLSQGSLMSDDTTQRGGQDPQRINVSHDGDLRDWTKKLDATPEQIKEAVHAVGNRADDVEMHLKGSRSSTNADQEARAEDGNGARI